MPFRIHNKVKHNNAILTEIKNVIIINDVATRIDLRRNKETEAGKTSILMNVIIDDEINLNEFKKRQND